MAERPINNAQLIGARIYRTRLDLFDRWFERHGGDVRRSVSALGKLMEGVEGDSAYARLGKAVGPMREGFVKREQGRLLGELSEFLSIPSVSALPAHAQDCRRAAEWLSTHLRSLGCPVVNIIEGPGHPVVWAESPRVPDRPTLLIYGHYDVQPPDPLDEWITEPFTPTVRDGKLYARGAADDKGQVFCLLKAYEAVLDSKRLPPLNVHFIFEGEEESGGKVIFDLLHNEPERTRADAALVCDMSYYAPGWPAVYTALRGLCYAEISVRTLERDLHSGTYGGVAPNGLETLVRILSQLKSPTGEIRIPGLYEAVEPPTQEELDTWKRLPFDQKRFLSEEVTGQGPHRPRRPVGVRESLGAAHLRDPRHQGAASSAKGPRPSSRPRLRPR